MEILKSGNGKRPQRTFFRCRVCGCAWLATGSECNVLEHFALCACPECSQLNSVDIGVLLHAAPEKEKYANSCGSCAWYKKTVGVCGNINADWFGCSMTRKSGCSLYDLM